MPVEDNSMNDQPFESHIHRAIELLRKANMIHDLERQDVLMAAEALTITGALVREAIDEISKVTLNARS